MLLLLGLTWVEDAFELADWPVAADLLDALDRLGLRHAGSHGEQNRERAEACDQMSFHD